MSAELSEKSRRGACAAASAAASQEHDEAVAHMVRHSARTQLDLNEEPPEMSQRLSSYHSCMEAGVPLEALALSQELASGLSMVKELLEKLHEEDGATANESSRESHVSLWHQSSRHSEAGHCIDPIGCGASSTSSAGSAALDRARAANAMPSAAPLAASASDDSAVLREKLRVAEAVADEARAEAAMERAGRLAAEAKLREMGIEVPASIGAGGGGSTPPSGMPKGRSAGEMVGGFLRGLMPKTPEAKEPSVE